MIKHLLTGCIYSIATIYGNIALVYVRSEKADRCRAEQNEVWQGLERIKTAIGEQLSITETREQLQDAIFLLHATGYFKKYEAISQLYHLQLRRESEKFVRINQALSETEIVQYSESMHMLGNIFSAAQQLDITALKAAIDFYRSREDKDGYVIRNRAGKSLWSPDTIIGHTLASAPTSFADEVVAQYPISHMLLTQAVRSGASINVLEKLLARMDFENLPVYTKHHKLQTALQAAIEIESTKVLSLLLAQPNLGNTEFAFNPINTIIFNTLNTAEQSLTEKQRAMLMLLRERDFELSIVRTLGRHTTIAGYIAELTPT
jgi:hypothetical protein